MIVVGNAKSGKSSVIRRYASRSFTTLYETTVGADYTKRDVTILVTPSAAVTTRLQMWDIAGQDRFTRLTRVYFSGARGAVIVCDAVRRGTVEAVREWKREIDDCLGESDPVRPSFLDSLTFPTLEERESGTETCGRERRRSSQRFIFDTNF